jgi:hypothetical protein
VAPEPKADGVSAAPTVEPTLMGMIASLSPWAEARSPAGRAWGLVPAGAPATAVAAAAASQCRGTR